MTTPASRRAARAPVQQAAVLLGLVFLGVGVLGFLPGVTTDHGSLEFASHESGAELFGLFPGVDPAHPRAPSCTWATASRV
ncbi:DUF4383 domain-containing protein [Streptomyces massasporeus]|uniref:DUF4383 domain-containing protein n=1 Tax=Streptomyces massasporeus TaxID=67324 RepID=UPI00381D7916